MPAKPHGELSHVIADPVWPDLTPRVIADAAAAILKEIEDAEAATMAARHAAASVRAQEAGHFAEASARAYDEQESIGKDLIAAGRHAYADLMQAAGIHESLMNRIVDIDAEAHEALKAIEPLKSKAPAEYGARKLQIGMTGMWLAQEASAASNAQLMAILAKIPTEYKPSYQSSGAQPKSDHQHSASPVDHKTSTGGGISRDRQGKQEHGQGSSSDNDKELSNGKAKTDHQGKEQNHESQQGNQSPTKELGDRQGKLTDDSQALTKQPGVGSAAGQGLNASPMTSPGGGMGSGSGAGGGSGSGGSGLSGLARPMSNSSGLGGNSAPRMPAAPTTPAGGGPIQDFAKGFNSGAGSATPPAMARPLLPAEGVRPPMPPMNAASGVIPSSASTPVTSGPASTPVGPGPQGIPMGSMGSPGGSGGAGGPLPPFGSDMRGAGTGSGAPAASAGGAQPGAGAAPPATSTGTGAPGAVLSGGGAGGAAGGFAESQYGLVDLGPAQQAVWELIHQADKDTWHIEWAVGLFDTPGGMETLFVSNEGSGFVPASVTLPLTLVPALTDPALTSEFLSRWFGWADVTRLMVEYANAREAAGKSKLLGFATSASTTAAERAGVHVRSADRGLSPIPHDAPRPGLTFDRAHRLRTLDPALDAQLADARDVRGALLELLSRCRNLVSGGVQVATCGHDVMARLNTGQGIPDGLSEELRIAHKERVLLASAQRPGVGEYGPPEEYFSFRDMYRTEWRGAQVLEALRHLSSVEPNLRDAGYAIVAAERIG